MFYLTYNYTNARRSRMAIACVKRLSRGDQCRVGRAISRLYNQGMLPHLNRGKKERFNEYVLLLSGYKVKAPDCPRDVESGAFLCMKSCFFRLAVI